jgi:hypothetical protein
MDLPASSRTHQQILENYPHLPEPDVVACLPNAGGLLHAERASSLVITMMIQALIDHEIVEPGVVCVVTRDRVRVGPLRPLA